MSRDRRIQQLINQASEGDYDAAEALIFEALRSGRSYWDPDHYMVNVQRLGIARFLGYLRWPRWPEFVAAIQPTPFHLTRYSSLGPDVVEEINPNILYSAVGGLAERVAPLIGVDRDVILDVAATASEYNDLVQSLRRSEQPVSTNPRVRDLRIKLHDLRNFVRDEGLGPDLRNDEYISTVGAARTKAAVAGLKDWIDSSYGHRSNRHYELHHAIFYLELALAIQCEVDKHGPDEPTTSSLDYLRIPYLPYPSQPNRGWRPGRGCVTKGKRQARKAMLGPAIFAVSSYLLERLL